MEDERLVKLALEGDDDALKKLHERYVDQMFRYVYVQVGNYHDAEEIIQDIFYKMARNLATFKRKSTFKTWLFAIGRHHVIDFQRQQRRHAQPLLDEEEMDFALHSAASASAEIEVVATEWQKQVLQCVHALPDDYRTVLHLRFIEGFSVRDTAHVMSKTVLSIKALQHRAKKKLLDKIKSEVELI